MKFIKTSKFYKVQQAVMEKEIRQGPFTEKRCDEIYKAALEMRGWDFSIAVRDIMTKEEVAQVEKIWRSMGEEKQWLDAFQYVCFWSRALEQDPEEYRVPVRRTNENY